MTSIRHLQYRTPRQWFEFVSKIPLRIQTEVAYVIWWDWFAGRKSRKRWPHLDYFLKRKCNQKKLKPSELYDILKKADYPDWLAYFRSHLSETQDRAFEDEIHKG